jgi:hypothetical protein
MQSEIRGYETLKEAAGVRRGKAQEARPKEGGAGFGQAASELDNA